MAAWALLGLALSASACGRTPAGPSGVFIDPSTVAPPAPPPTLVVSGVVTGDGQPLAEATVELSGLNIAVKTDATGRYAADIYSAGLTAIWVTAIHDQFRFQPCAVWTDHLGGARSLIIDVALTARKGPSTVPSAPVAGRRTISGTVYTETAHGKQPVANASVGWDVSSDDLRAWTETDSAGRFWLCGVWVHSRVGIVSYQGLLTGSSSVQPGTGDANVEVVLR